MKYDFGNSLAAFYVAGIKVYYVKIEPEPINGDIAQKSDDAQSPVHRMMCL